MHTISATLFQAEPFSSAHNVVQNIVGVLQKANSLPWWDWTEEAWTYTRQDIQWEIFFLGIIQVAGFHIILQHYFPSEHYSFLDQWF